MLSFPETTTAREIQRNYKRIFDYVNRTKKPVVVMRNNKPTVAIVDFKKLERQEAIAAAIKSRLQAESGKAKILTSFSDLE